MYKLISQKQAPKSCRQCVWSVVVQVVSHEIPSSGATLNSGVTLNSHTFFKETHWLVSITAISQVTCVLGQLLKVSGPCSINFLNVATTFDILFLPKQQFSKEKIWLVDFVLRWSFDWKLTCPNVFRDVQKPLFDLCISQFVTVLTGEISISFSSHKILLCLKSPHSDGVTLNNFGFVYLTETRAEWNSHFRIWKREAVVVVV